MSGDALRDDWGRVMMINVPLAVMRVTIVTVMVFLGRAGMIMRSVAARVCVVESGRHRRSGNQRRHLNANRNQPQQV